VTNLQCDNDASVSYGAKRAVEIGEKHKELTDNLAAAMVPPEMTRVRLATHAPRCGGALRRTWPRQRWRWGGRGSGEARRVTGRLRRSSRCKQLNARGSGAGVTAHVAEGGLTDTGDGENTKIDAWLGMVLGEVVRTAR
jgi:hypothetical protein